MIGELCGKTTSANKEKKQMSYYKTWLGGGREEERMSPESLPLADAFEEAVAKGLATQASPRRGQTELPRWFRLWVGKLTLAEVQMIGARKEEELAGHQEDLERLLGGDMAKWTTAERTHAEMTGRRLAAVSLVLETWKEAKGDGQRAATFLPKEMEAAATAAA